MIFEMTRDYSIIVPLMIRNLLSLSFPTSFSRADFMRRSPYKEGVFLPTAEIREELAACRVGR